MNYLFKKTDYLKEKPQEIFEKRVVPRCGTEIPLCGTQIPQRGTGWKSLKMENISKNKMFKSDLNIR